MQASIFEFKYLKIKKNWTRFRFIKGQNSQGHSVNSHISNWKPNTNMKIHKDLDGWRMKNNNSVWNSRNTFQIKHMSATSIDTQLGLTPSCRYGAIVLFNLGSTQKNKPREWINYASYHIYNDCKILNCYLRLKWNWDIIREKKIRIHRLTYTEMNLRTAMLFHFRIFVSIHFK